MAEQRPSGRGCWVSASASIGDALTRAESGSYVPGEDAGRLEPLLSIGALSRLREFSNVRYSRPLF